MAAASLIELTLEPLRSDGATALLTDDADGVDAVKLCRLEHVSPGAYHVVTTQAGDDLWAAAAGFQQGLFPPGAALLTARLSFFFPDSPTPHEVDICPPAKLTLEFPADAPRVLPFLVRHHFRRPASTSL